MRDLHRFFFFKSCLLTIRNRLIIYSAIKSSLLTSVLYRFPNIHHIFLCYKESNNWLCTERAITPLSYCLLLTQFTTFPISIRSFVIYLLYKLWISLELKAISILLLLLVTYNIIVLLQLAFLFHSMHSFVAPVCPWCTVILRSVPPAVSWLFSIIECLTLIHTSHPLLCFYNKIF